jgi:hypothetical protein
MIKGPHQPCEGPRLPNCMWKIHQQQIKSSFTFGPRADSGDNHIAKKVSRSDCSFPIYTITTRLLFPLEWSRFASTMVVCQKSRRRLEGLPSTDPPLPFNHRQRLIALCAFPCFPSQTATASVSRYISHIWATWWFFSGIFFWLIHRVSIYKILGRPINWGYHSANSKLVITGYRIPRSHLIASRHISCCYFPRLFHLSLLCLTKIQGPSNY